MGDSRAFSSAGFGAVVVLAFAAAAPPTVVRATPVLETSISSFEGKEEPTVLYHPSTGSFTNDSYVNMTDQGGGIVRFTLRYHPDQDWWDGDRNTTNNDRQRAEVKGLGAHQSPGDMFEYAMDFRTSSNFFGGSGFDHIFQLKATDGDDGAPLVVLDPGRGTGASGSVRLWSGTAGSSSGVRSFTWTPNTWTHVVIRITTSSAPDGSTSDGQLVASVNGDAFKGVSNVPAYRTGSTDYRPKWGFYRGIASDLHIDDEYVEYKNVSAEQLLSGDANRDGKVDTLDFNALAANFGLTGRSWFQGDFNADGTVDTLDFNALAAHFGQTLAGSTGGLVPEPAMTMGVIVPVATVFARRPRRLRTI